MERRAVPCYGSCRMHLEKALVDAMREDLCLSIPHPPGEDGCLVNSRAGSRGKSIPRPLGGGKCLNAAELVDKCPSRTHLEEVLTYVSKDQMLFVCGIHVITDASICCFC